MSSLICIFWCKIAPSCLHFIDCFDLTGWNLIIFKISSLLFSVYPILPYRHCVVRLGSRTGPLSKRHNGQNGSVEIASRSSEPSDEAPTETALLERRLAKINLVEQGLIEINKSDREKFGRDRFDWGKLDCGEFGKEKFARAKLKDVRLFDRNQKNLLFMSDAGRGRRWGGARLESEQTGFLNVLTMW